MLQQIDSLIFDFGGVLVDLNKQRTLEAFTAMGFDATPYIGHYVQSGIFEKLELGQLSAAAFYDEVRRASGNEHLTDAEIAAAWNSMLVGVSHERLDMPIELRRRYPVYLLSNTNAIHWDYACTN